MAFESLASKLGGVFKKLRGKGKLSEQDVKDGALYVPIMDTEMQRNTLMRQNPYWLARW